MSEGTLFVVSAPSGAGKTTLCKGLIDELGGIRFSVSHTTRAPREGEVDGRDYFFVGEDEFMKMVRADEFAEWARVHGNLYGTSSKLLNETLSDGTDVMLDIDTQGARLIKERYPQGTFIFIMPPSMDELHARLGGRGTNTEDDMSARLKAATEEISQYKNYDYVIVNDILEEALQTLKSVVLARRAAISRVDEEWIRNNFLNEEAV